MKVFVLCHNCGDGDTIPLFFSSYQDALDYIDNDEYSDDFEGNISEVDLDNLEMDPSP